MCKFWGPGQWAERMAAYWKKKNGTRISLMDFNSTVGSSKRRMQDQKLFSQKLVN